MMLTMISPLGLTASERVSRTRHRCLPHLASRMAGAVVIAPLG
jgi:hypothetical protein